METVTNTEALRSRVAAWRRDGLRVGFVPTMGNLHQGHLALVRRAREAADRVVVSIFVNPFQFGPNEDYDSYPRTPERDADLLQEEGADLLFLPAVETMYPRGTRQVTRVEVPGISDELCGASRPGFFVGVATVVAKLFNLVQPDLAVFGEKDYQQLVVIRRMVADLCFPIEILGVPTVREADGLAMSSRNAYLTPEERAVAPELQRSLRQAADRLLAGERDFAAIEAAAARRLDQAGFRTDYVSIRRAEDLAPPAPADRDFVILAAAWLGPRARLIDNIRVSD